MAQRERDSLARAYGNWAFWQNIADGVQNANGDWRAALDAVGLMAVETVEWSESDVDRTFEKLLARVQQIDETLAEELDLAVADIMTACQHEGWRIGYALAQTMPNRLEAFADWPERAVRFAGLPVQER